MEGEGLVSGQQRREAVEIEEMPPWMQSAFRIVGHQAIILEHAVILEITVVKQMGIGSCFVACKQCNRVWACSPSGVHERQLLDTKEKITV